MQENICDRDDTEYVPSVTRLVTTDSVGTKQTDRMMNNKTSNLIIIISTYIKLARLKT